MITFEGKTIALQPGQTVLAGLEEAGVAVETSCRAGVCQSCLMQVVEGAPTKRSQPGLSPSQVARGLFMPCVCTPEGDMTLARAGDAPDFSWLQAGLKETQAEVRRVFKEVVEGRG